MGVGKFIKGKRPGNKKSKNKGLTTKMVSPKILFQNSIF